MPMMTGLLECDRARFGFTVGQAASCDARPMATEGTWMVLKRPARKYLAALDAPKNVLVLEHDIDYRDYEATAEPVSERSREIYSGIRAAASASGLVDVSVTSPRQRRKDAPTFVWGEEAEALMEQMRREHPGDDGRGWGWAPASMLVFSDPSRETFLLIVSDWDDCFPIHVLMWGSDTEPAIEAVEAAMQRYRERHPVRHPMPGEFS